MKRFLFLVSLSAFAIVGMLMFMAAPAVNAAVAKESKPAEANSKEQEKDGDEADSDSEDAEQEGEKKAEDEKAEAESKSEDADEEKTEASEEVKDETKENGEAAADKKPDGKADEKSADKKRKTHTVEPKRLKIDAALDGTFVASEMKEVALRPESWSSYEIVEVVDHGTKVHQGQTLIKFDTEKIDEAIEDLELAQRLNELAIMKAEQELPRKEKTLKLDFETAELAAKHAKEDFERYHEIERPLAIRTAEFMVKYYDFMLNYEKEELDQLEKMYEADDLTEETEEIVLKRQRNSVEFAEFSLEHAKQDRDDTLNVRLPRADIRIKDALERTALAHARAQAALSLDLNEARYELEQRKAARVKSLQKHADLLRDRELMEIKAPADGIVFYGQNVNGRWSDTQTLINKYKPHGSISPGNVLMTVVESRPVFVTSMIEEGKRPDVRDGQKARIALPSDSSDRIAGKVKSISTIPVSPGKFEISFNVEQNEVPEWVVPGMSCKVHITTYNKKDALVVPKAAVRDDEVDEEQKYVWLVDSDDEEAKPKRRNVKVGREKGDDIEIVKGLKKGDVISLEDEDKKDKQKE